MQEILHALPVLYGFDDAVWGTTVQRGTCATPDGLHSVQQTDGGGGGIIEAQHRPTRIPTRQFDDAMDGRGHGVSYVTRVNP